MTKRTNSISIERDNSTYHYYELKEAFALFDRIGGGIISTRDLAFVMDSIGYQATPSQLEQMIREVDRDGNGVIDFSEFKLMMNHKVDSHLNTFSDDLLNEAFRIFDKDGNGLISKMEIYSVMSNLGEQLTDEELNAMINEADLDGNCQVDYGEFSALVRRLLQIENQASISTNTHESQPYEGRGIIPYIDDDLAEETNRPFQ